MPDSEPLEYDPDALAARVRTFMAEHHESDYMTALARVLERDELDEPLRARPTTSEPAYAAYSTACFTAYQLSPGDEVCAANTTFDALVNVGTLDEDAREVWVEMHPANSSFIRTPERFGGFVELVRSITASRIAVAGEHNRRTSAAGHGVDHGALDARVRTFMRQNDERDYMVALDRVLAGDELESPALAGDKAGGDYDGLSNDELDREVRKRMAETGETDYVKALHHVTERGA